MGRVISREKLDQIAQARAENPDAIGPILGELVINGNIPVSAIADMLAVAPLTIYRWMYSHAAPRDLDKISKIQKLLVILRKAKRAKDTPLRGTTEERTQQLVSLVHLHRPRTATQA